MGGVAAFRPEIEDARADQAEMQKGGGRARSAVEHEGERPVGALDRIGGVENGSALLARLVVEGERAGGRGVSELAGRCVDCMLGDGVRRQQAQHAFAAVAVFGRLVLRGCRADGAGE